MHQEDGNQRRDDETEPDQRPCRRPRVRQQLQKHETGQAEDDAGDREQIQEQRPDGPGVAALVQIVEV